MTFVWKDIGHRIFGRSPRQGFLDSVSRMRISDASEDSTDASSAFMLPPLPL
jgi:hypothetical protein